MHAKNSRTLGIKASLNYKVFLFNFCFIALLYVALLRAISRVMSHLKPRLIIARGSYLQTPNAKKHQNPLMQNRLKNR